MFEEEKENLGRHDIQEHYLNYNIPFPKRHKLLQLYLSKMLFMEQKGCPVGKARATQA